MKKRFVMNILTGEPIGVFHNELTAQAVCSVFNADGDHSPCRAFSRDELTLPAQRRFRVHVRRVRRARVSLTS